MVLTAFTGSKMRPRIA